MDETNQPRGTEEQDSHEGKLVRFGRRHPAWTIAGLAAAGLVGGIEMAAGIVLGAGIVSLLRRDSAAHDVAPAGTAP